MSGSPASDTQKGQPGLFQAALFGMCPHCGERTLFAAPSMVADGCRVCGGELASLERWGRLAGILTILLTAVIIGAAIALDEAVRPPIWIHLLLWVPITIGGVLMALRLLKTAGVYRSYLLANESDS